MQKINKFQGSKLFIQKIPAIGVLLFAGFSSAYANTNLVVNGNFSEPGTGCAAGTTTLPGWTISAGNIDIESASCSGLNSAHGGTYFLDLTGSHAENGVNDVATLSQTIVTVVGQAYKLTFSFGANPQGQTMPYPNDSELKAMTVYVNGSLSGVYRTHTAGVAPTDPQWKQREICFVATSTSTTITFDSLNGSVTNPSDFGPLLDDVSLVAVKN